MSNLLDKQPYLGGVNLPVGNGSYQQLHFHGPNLNTLTSSHIKVGNSYGQTFNSYESAMLDLAADLGGYKRY